MAPRLSFGRPRARTVTLFALAALAIAIAATPAGRMTWYGARAWLADTSQFTQCTPDPRIWCEPGAEAFGAALAPLLPAATLRVEAAFGMPFTATVRVQVYASRESFSRHSGVTPQAAGAVSLGLVHLSPRLAPAGSDEEAVVMHELAHLHLIQRIGAMGIGKLPNWLWEGLPTYLSGGGGARNTSRANAKYALLHGRRFEPEDGASLLFPKSAGAYGLEHGMYYLQASLLLEWMDHKDPQAFRHMLAALGEGQGLDAALAASYKKPMAALWQEFLSTLND